jgi:hypothetical protein
MAISPIASAVRSAGSALSAAIASGAGRGREGLPEVVIISTSLRTFAGWSSAISCAIMPPIDMPMMSACRMPSASSSPAVSAARSSSV